MAEPLPRSVRRVRRRTVVRTAVVVAAAVPLAGCHLFRDEPDPAADPYPDRLAGRTDVATITGLRRSIGDLTISPDGTLLAATGGDGGVWLWDLRTHQPAGRPRDAYKPVTEGPGPVDDRVAFSPDGRLLAVSDERDGIVRLWDVAAGRFTAAPVARTGHLLGLGFSRDGRVLVVADGFALRMSDAATGVVRSEQPGSFFGVSFSRDGRFANVGTGTYGRTSTVHVWDPATGRAVGGWQPPDVFGMLRVAFSPDGRLLAAHDNRTLRYLDAATYEPIGPPVTPRAPSSAFHVVAFSPDGTVLATASTQGQRGTVDLWDVASGQPAGPSLTGLGQLVDHLAFAPSGRFLAVGDGARIRLWTLPQR